MQERWIGMPAGARQQRIALVAGGTVGLATWLGILLGLALKLAVVIAMLGLFAFAWFL